MFNDWLPFWNIFEAEIDATEIPAVSKFGYLKELLEPKVGARKSFLERPPTHVHPLEISCDQKQKKKGALDPNAVPYRPKRDVAVAARQRIQEEANTSNLVYVINFIV